MLRSVATFYNLNLIIKLTSIISKSTRYFMQLDCIRLGDVELNDLIYENELFKLQITSLSTQ